MKNNQYFYPAIFSKEGKFYNVKFIDFDNVFTFGEGFEEAYYMAQDALYNILYEYKDNLPNITTNYKDIKMEKNEIIVIVELNIIKHKKKILH